MGGEEEKTVKCPICGKEVGARGKAAHFRNVHPESNYEEYKDKFELVRTEIVKEAEEKPGEEFRQVYPYETPKPPSEVLKEVLTQAKKYGITDECIEFIVDEARLMGRLEPTELHGMLSQMAKTFTGLKDERIIPHIVRRYVARIEEEEEKARRSSAVYYPTRARGFPERIEHIDYYYRRPRYEDEYVYREPHREPYREPYRYREPVFREYGVRYVYPEEGRFGYITRDDLDRYMHERDERRRISAIEDYIYRELPERLRRESREELKELESRLMEKVEGIKELIKAGGEVAQEPEITKKDLEMLKMDQEKRLTELEMEHSKKMGEMERKLLEERLKSTSKEVEELKKEVKEAKGAKTAYDIAHKLIDEGSKIVLQERPVRGMIRAFRGVSEKERKIEREGELTEEELEMIPEESVEEG